MDVSSSKEWSITKPREINTQRKESRNHLNCVRTKLNVEDSSSMNANAFLDKLPSSWIPMTNNYAGKSYWKHNSKPNLKITPDPGRSASLSLKIFTKQVIEGNALFKKHKPISFGYHQLLQQQTLKQPQQPHKLHQHNVDLSDELPEKPVR